MAPKVNCNPVKLASIVSYFQKSRVAHSIKDLEKHLPSVASINGMQVKDYLQALSDESKINVEKIGSGNWYWSFPSEDKKTRQKALDQAQTAHDKQNEVVQSLKQKYAEIQAQRNDEAEMLDAGAESREELTARQTVLEAEVKTLQKQLAAFSDTDPAELERKKEDIKRFKTEAEQRTDEIYSMESEIKKRGADEEALKDLCRDLYGDEFDVEDGVLKELM